MYQEDVYFLVSFNHFWLKLTTVWVDHSLPEISLSLKPHQHGQDKLVQIPDSRNTDWNWSKELLSNGASILATWVFLSSNIWAKVENFSNELSSSNLSCLRTHKHTHTHTHISTHKHTHTQAHTDTSTHTHTHTCSLSFTHTYTLSLPFSTTYTYTHSLSHTLTLFLPLSLSLSLSLTLSFFSHDRLEGD